MSQNVIPLDISEEEIEKELFDILGESGKEVLRLAETTPSRPIVDGKLFGITAPEFKEIKGCSVTTARARLDKLFSDGKLEKKQVTCKKVLVTIYFPKGTWPE